MHKPSIFQPLIISGLLHVVAVLLSIWIPTELPPKQEAIEIEILPQNETSPKKEKQFVSDLEPLQKQLEDLEKKAHFLSRTTQRVKEEQIARKTGRTENSMAQAAAAIKRPNMEEQRPKIQGGEIPAHTRNVAISDSTLSEFVPDVREGGFTSLNTDQFIFYTFYARINEQIRNRWVNNIRTFVRNIEKHELGLLSQKQQVTQVEIILTKDGEFLKAFVHQQSENTQLDAAAIAAFKLSAPYNNPPLEIVNEEDGLIHLHYQFHVQFQPRYMAGSRP